MKAKSNGRYYDLEPLVYQGKVFAVRIHGNLRPAFSKAFVVHDLGGVYQYMLSRAQLVWLRQIEKQTS